MHLISLHLIWVGHTKMVCLGVCVGSNNSRTCLFSILFCKILRVHSWGLRGGLDLCFRYILPQSDDKFIVVEIETSILSGPRGDFEI